MQKILVCSSHFHPHVGGVERYVEELFSRMAASGAYEVHIITLDNKGPRTEFYRGLRIHRLPYFLSVGDVFRMPSISAWRNFVHEEVIGKDFKIISTQTRFHVLCYLGMRLAKHLRIRHVHTEHGGSFVRHPNLIIQGGAYIFDQAIGRQVLSGADRITGVSRQVIEFIKLWIGRDGTIVHNGIDPQFWNPITAMALPNELSEWIASRRPILFIGRIARAKGWLQLLDAVEGMSESDRKVLCFLVVGDGPESVLLRQKISASPILLKSVLFLGRQRPEAIRDILAVADYVNPSYSGEGLQTTLLEAASMGSPIISTDVSGAIEVVTSSQVGRLIAQQDVMELRQALSQAALIPLRSAGREIVLQDFSWKRIVADYRKVLTS